MTEKLIKEAIKILSLNGFNKEQLRSLGLRVKPHKPVRVFPKPFVNVFE